MITRRRTPNTPAAATGPRVPTPDDLPDREGHIRTEVASTRLWFAREAALAVAARVEPTPTFDAVVTDLGWNPRTEILSA